MMMEESETDFGSAMCLIDPLHPRRSVLDDLVRLCRKKALI